MGEQLLLTNPMQDSGLISTGQSLLGMNVTPARADVSAPVNLGIFVPFRVMYRVTICKIIVGCGATAGSNFDAGVFDRFGNLIVKTGATARSTGSEQAVDIADTVIYPGLYYMGMSVNAAAQMAFYYFGTAPVVQRMRMMGIYEMASAYPLPDPVTFAAYSQTTGYIPAIALQLLPY